MSLRGKVLITIGLIAWLVGGWLCAGIPKDAWNKFTCYAAHLLVALIIGYIWTERLAEPRKE